MQLSDQIFYYIFHEVLSMVTSSVRKGEENFNFQDIVDQWK